MTETRALGLARIAMGALFVVRTTALSNLLPVPLAHVSGPLLGWPAAGFRFGWCDLVLPTALVAALCVVRTLAGLAFATGLAPRTTGLVASTSALAVLSQDPFGVYYTLLVLFAGVGVLALTESGTELAVRMPGSAKRPPPRDGSGAWLVVVFVASIYAWSALAKLHASWLDGAVLRALAEDRHLHEPIASWLLESAGLRHAVALGVPLAELALAALLLGRRTRRTAVVLAVLFHAMLEIAARPDVIGWAMLALLPAAWGSTPARAEAR